MGTDRPMIPRAATEYKTSSVTIQALAAQDIGDLGRQGVTSLGQEPEDGWGGGCDQSNRAEAAVVPEEVAGVEEAAPGEELVVFALCPLLEEAQALRQVVLGERRI